MPAWTYDSPVECEHNEGEDELLSDARRQILRILQIFEHAILQGANGTHEGLNQHSLNCSQYVTFDAFDSPKHMI